MGLKGVWHEIFELRFFSWIRGPQAHKYSIGAVLIFFSKIRGNKLFSGVNDTGEKFIVDTGQK